MHVLMKPEFVACKHLKHLTGVVVFNHDCANLTLALLFTD